MNYIFFSSNILERAGGPSTYLYNLKEGIEEKNKKDIKFIYNEKVKSDISKSNISKVKKILAKISPRIYEQIMLNHINKEGTWKEKISNLKDANIMHFHTTIDFTKYYKYLPTNTIKILTSHCPEMPCIEFSNSLKAKAKEKKYDFYKAQTIFYEKIDKPAFKKADILVFPSKEAMEPYYETCKEFDQLIKDKKIKYLLTGTKPLKFNKNKNDFRKEYKIPENAFLICFIGRHNEVKGYDNFIKICKSLLKNKEDIYIITAGIGNIESPKNSRWIDIGWTNDPGSVVNASDIFILPNKRTYFDLVLLEVLSIGKTCIVSNTGGNKTVEKLSNGIFKYNTITEAINIIEKLYVNKDRLLEYEKINKEVYNKYFTVEKFAQNYIKLIDEIRREGK